MTPIHTARMMPSTATSEFLSGVKAELPILLGVAPFGMIYGALAVGAGLPVGMAQAMSAIVFAGSAQFIAAQLIGGGAPALVLLLTTFIVNIRHMLYSASIAPYFRPLRPAWKWLLAYLLTDEAFAVAIIHYQQTENSVNHGDTEDTDDLAFWILRVSDASVVNPPVRPTSAIGIFWARGWRCGRRGRLSTAIGHPPGRTRAAKLVAGLRAAAHLHRTSRADTQRPPSRLGRSRRRSGRRDRRRLAVQAGIGRGRARRHRCRRVDGSAGNGAGRAEMTGTALWLTLLGMGLITYGIRLSMILLLGRVQDIRGLAACAASGASGRAIRHHLPGAAAAEPGAWTSRLVTRGCWRASSRRWWRGAPRTRC